MQAHGFRVSFTPLLAVLFTFPSRYSFAIGLTVVLSLGGWCRLLRTGFLRPRPTQGTARFARASRTGLSPSTARLPMRVPLRAQLPSRQPYNPGRASTPPVWAGPLSLAATRGVTVVLLSSAYLDVSVRRVRLRLQGGCRTSRAAGCPIRVSADPRLLAPPRGLSRPAAPFVASVSHRHPPCALIHSLAAHRIPADCRAASLALVSARSRTRLSLESSRLSLFCLCSARTGTVSHARLDLPHPVNEPAPPSGAVWRMWGSNPRPQACKACALAD